MFCVMLCCLPFSIVFFSYREVTWWGCTFIFYHTTLAGGKEKHRKDFEIATNIYA